MRTRIKWGERRISRRLVEKQRYSRRTGVVVVADGVIPLALVIGFYHISAAAAQHFLVSSN